MASCSKVCKEDIIAQVQLHDILYNKSTPEYKDAEKKENVWRGIANVLCLEVSDVQKQWRSLRDTYLRLKKESLTKSGQAPNPPVKWKFWKSMQFLKSHTAYGRTSGNMPGTTDGEITENNDHEEPAEEEIESYDTTQSIHDEDGDHGSDDDATLEKGSSISRSTASTSRPTTPSLLRKRRTKAVSDPVADKVIEYLTNRQNSKTLKKGPDADMSFHNSLYPSFQNMEPRTKSLLKINIQKLVHEAEFPETQPLCPQTYQSAYMQTPQAHYQQSNQDQFPQMHQQNNQNYHNFN